MENSVAAAKIKHLLGHLLIYTATGVSLNLYMYCEKKYYRRYNDDWYLSGSPDPTYRVYSRLDGSALNVERKAYEVDLLFPSTLPVTASEVEHREQAIALFTNVIRTRINEGRSKMTTL